MLKKIFIILFSAFLGISGNPEILMASDSVAVTGLDDTGVVKTVEVVAETESAEAKAEVIKSETPAQVVVVQPKPVVVTPSVPANNIKIAGKTLRIEDVDSTLVDSGDHVNKYGKKFLYGHNSWAVFRGLYNMVAGNTFTVTYGGVTKTYQVAQVVIFEKNGNRLQINGAGNYMVSVSKARYQGTNYDLSLMTCYGTSYGNGDASHRLVIFANEI